MTQQVRVSLGFAQLTDGNLGPFAGGVIDGLTATAAVFNALPIPVATLTGLKETFDTALIATVDGNTQQTAAKNNARAALIAALRKNALYVEIASNNDLALLLSSGYQAASTNRAQSPLQQVEVVALENSASGELKARVRVQPNTKVYEGRIRAVGGEFGPTITFANSRAILFKGLTAGVNYIVQICAIGGSTGRSDWSDPVGKMAM
jgi:hypothetical protein